MKVDVEEGRAHDERMRAAMARATARNAGSGFVESAASLADAKKMLPRGHLQAGCDRLPEVDPERVACAAIGFRESPEDDVDPGVLSARRRKFLSQSFGRGSG